MVPLIMIGVVNVFFSKLRNLFIFSSNILFLTTHPMHKILKTGRLYGSNFYNYFSIIECFLRVLETSTTYVSQSAAHHNYLDNSYCHYLRVLFLYFKHFNTLALVNKRA